MDKIKHRELTKEEISKLANVFQWLITEDKKQNLHFYSKNSDGDLLF